MRNRYLIFRNDGIREGVERWNTVVTAESESEARQRVIDLHIAFKVTFGTFEVWPER